MKKLIYVSVLVFVSLVCISLACILWIVTTRNSSNVVKQQGAPTARASSGIVLPPGAPSELLLKYIQLGETAFVKQILQQNPDLDVNRPRAEGNKTPIYLACEKGYADMVKLLLKRKSDVNVCDNDGHYSALTVAAKNGHINVIEELLNSGIDKDARDGEDRTPLYAAAANNQPKLVEFLCKYKAKINYHRRDGWSPLTFAANKRYAEVVDILCKAGANVNDRYPSGDTTLLIAATWGASEIVKILIKYKADLETCDDSRNTALIKAIMYNHEEIVDLLCQAGANVKHPGSMSLPLQEAVYKNNKKMIKTLLKHGADPYQHAIMADRRIIDEARRKCSQEIVDLLLNHRK